MSSLLPPNASRLQRDLEAATNWLTELPAEEIKRIANPWTCQAELLPWLAWAWSVDQWDSDWTEQVKRQVLADSPAWHRVKGTPYAVRRLLAAQTIEAVLREWWEFDDAPPHSFRVEITGDAPLSEELPAQILRAVAYGKNARSYMDRLRVRRDITGAVRVGHALALGYRYHIGPRVEIDVEPQAITFFTGVAQGATYHITPAMIGVDAEPLALYAGGLMTTSRITEIYPNG